MKNNPYTFCDSINDCNEVLWVLLDNLIKKIIENWWDSSIYKFSWLKITISNLAFACLDYTLEMRVNFYELIILRVK